MSTERVKLPTIITAFHGHANNPFVIDQPTKDLTMLEVIQNDTTYYTTVLDNLYIKCKQLNWDFFTIPYVIRGLQNDDIVFTCKGKLFIDGIVFNDDPIVKTHALALLTEQIAVPITNYEQTPTPMYYYVGLSYKTESRNVKVDTATSNDYQYITEIIK